MATHTQPDPASTDFPSRRDAAKTPGSAPAAPRGLRETLSHSSGREGFARALLLTAACLSFLVSVALYFGGDSDAGIFVGIWVPSILALGALLVPRRAADHERRRP